MSGVSFLHWAAALGLLSPSQRTSLPRPYDTSSHLERLARPTTLLFVLKGSIVSNVPNISVNKHNAADLCKASLRWAFNCRYFE
jgi:hypothetical protein